MNSTENELQEQTSGVRFGSRKGRLKRPNYQGAGNLLLNRPDFDEFRRLLQILNAGFKPLDVNITHINRLEKKIMGHLLPQTQVKEIA